MVREGLPMGHVAEFWHTVDDGKVQCDLCPHRCSLREGAIGLCKVRTAEGGVLRAAGYGLVSSAAMDPIEKKPLYHFHPGADIFSIGGWGCNLSCTFCQNWTISQQVLEGGACITPEAMVSRARGKRTVGIAYTYNEPLVGFEFVRDCARLAKEAGLKNVLVTNGFMESAPAAQLLPLVDALNIDVKSMDDVFYRTHCGGRLAPVLAFAVQAVEAGCHVEITNLLIPGLNDAEDDVRALADWVRGTLGRHVPLHLSAYRPEYKMRIAATPVEALGRAYALCSGELHYVYLGNVIAADGSDTRCPQCGHVWIERAGYRVRVSGLDAGECGNCGRPAEVVMG